MTHRRGLPWVTVVLLCIAWTASSGDGASQRPRSTREWLRITVIGDIDDVVLSDPLGRSNRDSSGYVSGDIPECVWDGDLRVDEDPLQPMAMGFSMNNPQRGVYRLSGRADKKTPVQIQVALFCVDGHGHANSWEGAVKGKSARRIAVGDGRRDSCDVFLRRLSGTRRKAAGS